MVGLVLAGCATAPRRAPVGMPPLPPLHEVRRTLLIGRSMPLLVAPPATNLIARQVVMFSNLTGNSNWITFRDSPGPLTNPYPKLRTKTVFPVPSPPLPGALSGPNLAVDAPYGTNIWTANAWQQKVMMVDFVNFIDGKTYTLQTSPAPIKGAWSDSYTTVWSGSRDDYWRVTLPVSGSQSSAMRFVRMKQAP